MEYPTCFNQQLKTPKIQYQVAQSFEEEQGLVDTKSRPSRTTLPGAASDLQFPHQTPKTCCVCFCVEIITLGGYQVLEAHLALEGLTEVFLFFLACEHEKRTAVLGTWHLANHCPTEKGVSILYIVAKYNSHCISH